MDAFWNQIKDDFPLLKRKIKGKRVVYLDSAASSLKPRQVLLAMDEYYSLRGVNVFRGLYHLSMEATAKYEEAREVVAEFIGAKKPAEIVFVRNATEAINLVAYSLGKTYFREDDEIALTVMEHHSNLVPWQQIALGKRLGLKYLKIGKSGKLILNFGENNLREIDLRGFITKKTKVLAITYISNVLGTINPLRKIIKEVKRVNPSCLILIDAAQAVPHLEIDVSDLGADFLVFSGHKMLGPFGIGVLWGKEALLREMSPFLFGGEMVQEVSLRKTTFAVPPEKFEAGTPNIAGAIGLAAAIKYLRNLGFKKIREHEKKLTVLALSELRRIRGLVVYGPEEIEERGGVIAFNIAGIHPHDLSEILNEDNICIRSGHHCAMPLHRFLGVSASSRASFYIYNREEDIEALIKGIIKTQKILKA